MRDQNFQREENNSDAIVQKGWNLKIRGHTEEIWLDLTLQKSGLKFSTYKYLIS